MIIVPSILTDSLDTVQKQIDLTLSVGLSRVQVDIIDPAFADEVTITPVDLMDVDLKKLDIDIHLMTNDPIGDVVECGQIPKIKTIIAQIERMSSQKAFVEHVKSFAVDAGLSVDLYTTLEELDPDVLLHTSIVQIMGNKAGKQGQKFAGDIILEKIRNIAAARTALGATFLIAVDIGMTPENAKLATEAGADMVTPGSYLWNSSDLRLAIEAYS
jgi:ribulose-phosphate 3-epimerase